ncbi:MAG: hypothetical protein ACHP7K_06400, partial [Actinomycetales bacterium]
MAGVLVESAQLALCAVISAGVPAVSVYTLRTRNVHGTDGADSVFWTSFLALVVLLPAVLVPAVVIPPAGAVLAVLAASAAAAAYRYGPALEVRRR